ncbi:MAG: chromosome segregation protein SMC [Clostridia bacterium]|nr:chromosome segregation protein SMC [Clostridia bacterium]
MYLKKLEIQGFKSFADRICLEYNSGITSVVGPNGSGKSNIADSVRWVLGEQSAKTLRGTKMEDVIFAGTEHRKPMGFAEVSLTLDNSDNSLPIAYNEVTITRRVFRSGESEYSINKTSCRLKDIHELLLDTGLGKDGYSIIGQGRVDEILSTKSEDRRHIFEEASGIMKYKVRKLEAEKKLELTQQNLLRINDIISELENQIEPLRQQSETAKKYLALRENLRELEVNLYIENIARFKEKIKEYEEQYTTIRENINAETLKLENITQENQKNTEILKILEEKINTSRQEYYNLESNLEKCNSEIKINEEKINSLAQNVLRVDEEIHEISQKASDLSNEEESKRSKLKYLHEKHDEYSGKLADYEKQIETILASLGETERYIENLKSSIMDKLDTQSDKRTQVNNVKSHIENLRRRQNSIGSEVYMLLLEKDKDVIKKEDLSENIQKVDGWIKQARTKLELLNKEKKDLNINLEDFRKKQNSIKSETQFKSSRYKLLQDMEKSLEGYNRSVKEVLHACRQSADFGKGIHGALAQLITVEQKYETAIEMTLGGALQNIVTTDENDAKKAIEFLKKNKLGRATFLPISAVKGKYFENNLLDELKKQQGFCGVASDLISYNPEYKGIILSLLGKVAVVENLDAGIRIARKFGYTFRIVTLEGDILSTSGSMSGGSSDNRGVGILSRNREIVELQEALEKLRKEEVVLEKNISEAISMQNEVLNEIGIEENKVRENELVRIRDESHMNQVDENIKRTEAKIEMLKQEKEQLERQEVETGNELTKYEAELNEIEKDISETKAVIADYQEKHKEDQSARDLLHNNITDFKISVNSILESIASVKESLERILEEKDACIKNINKRDNEKSRCKNEIKGLNESNEGLRNIIKGYEEEKTGKTLEIDRIVEERKVIEEETSDIINQITDVNKNILLLQEEFNRIEVRKAKIESEMEAIQNRMWDEYELTYTNALEFKKDIGNIPAAQKKAAEYRNEIKQLGPVNVASIEEYIKTKERYEFMSLQKNDMEQAKEKLHKVIYEMTSIMKQQFMEQFKLINTNFSMVFKELFGGGRAELILVDKENVLESGIEIEVQPPGKKLQNMMLLSGGERAFTAIALLFSILRLRPTPFCILDEIEAALDDANVYRFAEYIKKFTNQTQFIMVTHRKGTMEAADTLYGVTMQEHGVSKVVSMKMGEKAS